MRNTSSRDPAFGDFVRLVATAPADEIARHPDGQPWFCDVLAGRRGDEAARDRLLPRRHPPLCLWRRHRAPCRRGGVSTADCRAADRAWRGCPGEKSTRSRAAALRSGRKSLGPGGAGSNDRVPHVGRCGSARESIARASRLCTAPFEPARLRRCGRLLDAGADPRQPNRAGSTPLHLAVQPTGRGGSGSDGAHQQQIAILRLLLERGAKLTDRDGKGKDVYEAAMGDSIRRVLDAAAG